MRISVTHQGKQYRRATGLFVSDPSLWVQEASSLQAKCHDYSIRQEVLKINARLSEREVDARTQEDVMEAIVYALGGVKKVSTPPPSPLVSTPSFWEYFEEWGERPSSSQRQRALAVRVVARIMGTKENWDEIDSSYWFRLQRRMEDAGYSVNYRWNIGTRLKCVMHEGWKLKYHRNDDFKEFSARKEKTEAIALTPAEIELLWAYNPKNDTYRKVRDLALIGYYSAARFSDYSRLSLDNIRDGRLVFVQKKTDGKVTMPASPRLVSLLERNGGHAPKVCQVVFNRYIKRIARDAGIDGIVELPKSKKKKDGEETHRWEMVQSHTFRRSMLTSLYVSGVSAKDCMVISGHKSLSAFSLYLKIGNEEAIERLAENDLFK